MPKWRALQAARSDFRNFPHLRMGRPPPQTSDDVLPARCGRCYDAFGNSASCPEMPRVQKRHALRRNVVPSTLRDSHGRAVGRNERPGAKVVASKKCGGGGTPLQVPLVVRNEHVASALRNGSGLHTAPGPDGVMHATWGRSMQRRAELLGTMRQRPSSNDDATQPLRRISGRQVWEVLLMHMAQHASESLLDDAVFGFRPGRQTGAVSFVITWFVAHATPIGTMRSCGENGQNNILLHDILEQNPGSRGEFLGTGGVNALGGRTLGAAACNCASVGRQMRGRWKNTRASTAEARRASRFSHGRWKQQCGNRGRARASAKVRESKWAERASCG